MEGDAGIMAALDTLRATRGPLFTLMAIGVYWGGLSGMMPDIKTRVGAGDGEMGLVLMAPALGSVLAMWAAPWAARRFGGKTLPFATLMIAVSFLHYFWAGQVASLAVALFLGGFAVAFADMVANMRIAALEVVRDQPLMNLNHGAFSVSFGITALAIALARKAGWGVLDIVPWLFAAALAYTIIGWQTRQPVVPGEETHSDARPPIGIVTLAGLVLFCAFIAENASEAWSALHVERTLGAPVGEGSFGPAVLGFVMAAARFSGQFFAMRFGADRLIIGSATLGVIGAVIVAAGMSKEVVLGGVFLLGMGVAVVVPTTNSILARKVSGPARSTAIARAWMLGLVGFFVGPSLMGGLAEVASLRLSFAAVAVFVLLIIPAVRALSARPAV